MKAMIRYIRIVFLLFTVCSILVHKASAQPATTINGAWKMENSTGQQVLLFVNGYFTHTIFHLKDKKFIRTRGGTYQLQNGSVRIQWEFDTEQKEQVGQTGTYAVIINKEELTSTFNNQKETWKRIDDATASLAGVWHITARMQDEKLTPIHQTGPRKTLKILSGSRFQWAAINPETKEFFGTGGGTYTFENGKYTELIEFFSRDSSRVGASLSFDGKLQNGDWHHSGLSSRGDKIYEVWSRVNKQP